MPHGIFNDPDLQAQAARISYHRRGLQNAFPDQGALTCHLMALEVVEAEAIETGSTRQPRQQLPVRWPLA